MKYLFPLICLALFGQNPLEMTITPNSLEDRDAPGKFVVTLHNVAPGETLTWRVYRDCDNDRVPDIQKSDCKGLFLEEKLTVKTVPATVVLQVAELRIKAGEPPLDDFATLWFTAFRDRPRISDLKLEFGLSGKEPCSWLRELFDVFLPGRACGPKPGTSLTPHRSVVGLPDIAFEVRRISLVEGAEPTAIAGTAGASGITWLDAENLLVTAAPIPRDLAETPAGEQAHAALGAGLYKVPIDGGEIEPLWRVPEGDPRLPAAPLALPDATIAFARQPLGKPPADEPAAILVFWKDGHLRDEQIPLPVKLYRLLAWNDKTGDLLALTLGPQESRPSFLRINRQSQAVTDLGYREEIYQAAMRAPTGEIAVTARFDVTSQYDWHLLIMDKHGNLQRPLVRRPQNDLMPIWSSDGHTIYYLAEIGRIKAY